MQGHSLKGGDHPWYVFKGHPVPNAANEQHSLVDLDTVHIPALIDKVFDRDYPKSGVSK